MSRQGLSPAFADRELNGEVLLGELTALRKSLVPQKTLNALAQEARRFPRLSPAYVVDEVRTLAERRFSTFPALADLLREWAPRIRTGPDILAFVQHLERLALTSAVLTGMGHVARRLASERPPE